ncbi:MAG: hypothetical protein ACP5PA_06205, partial [Elusimicrobiales bacterium]
MKEKARYRILEFKALFYVVFFIFPITLHLSSQEEVVENKARYENFLSGKLENALTKILGPNQVKVLVDV